MNTGSSPHSSSSLSLPTTNLTTSKSSDHTNSLTPNVEAPQSRKRSKCKLCLWLLGVVIVALGSIGAFFFLKDMLYVLLHPHRDMYFDETGGEVVDWSQVVRPMIMKDSKFDVVASVWVRDDDSVGKGDAFLRIDGEDRPEKLIYTGKVFRNVGVSDKTRFANVELQVPTHHFKQANLSNYDLRASFVIVQSNENRPSWLGFAKDYTTWRPPTMEVQSVRKHDNDPSLEDKIYDSFGITIPLVEFHNIASRRPGHTSETSMIEDDPSEAEADAIDMEDWINTRFFPPERTKERNSFELEFTREPVTEYHPYIVSRTHLRILKQDKILKRFPYLFAQKFLEHVTCTRFIGITIKNSEWHQCQRSYRDNGVFETMVEIQVPDDSEIETDGEWKAEWLYAPYLSAMSRAAGPKDIVPIPIDREHPTLGEDPTNSSSGYVTVNWRLSFSSLTQRKLLFTDSLSSTMESVYNMTEPEALLEDAQRNRDVTFGVLTHRADQDAHPRRIFALTILNFTISTVCFFLNIHYFYTLKSTTGLSRLGALLLGLRCFWDGITLPSPVLLIIGLIEPIGIFAAVSRLRPAWPSRQRSRGEKDDGKKKGWIPRLYIAKATHAERNSERFETRVSKKTKLLLFIIIFVAVNFTPTSYLLSPRVEIPDSLRQEPLPEFPHPVVTEFFQTLASASFFTGRILQYIMNFSSQTYAGSYKITSLLWLIGKGVEFLDALPVFAGRTSRIHGVTVAEGIVFMMAIVDFVQAVKYRNARSMDEEDVE